MLRSEGFSWYAEMCMEQEGFEGHAGLEFENISGGEDSQTPEKISADLEKKETAETGLLHHSACKWGEYYGDLFFQGIVVSVLPG